MQVKPDSILNEDISERIHKTEEYYEIKFPESYVGFIKKYNVGIPITNRLAAHNNVFIVERFLGFINDLDIPVGCYDISVVLTQIEDRLIDDPDADGIELIPIAALFAGDFVCLDCRENKEEPSVCIWSHEESEDFEPVTYKVADTFTEFIEMLY